MALDNDGIYQALVQFANTSEQTRWNRMYNFLTANSIMILGWGAVFAGSDSRSSTIFLLPVSLLGIVGGIWWAALSYRGTRFLHLFNAMGAAMEADSLDSENCRPFQELMALSGDMTLQVRATTQNTAAFLERPLAGQASMDQEKCGFHVRRIQPWLLCLSEFGQARSILELTPLVFSLLYVCLFVLGILRLAYGDKL